MIITHYVSREITRPFLTIIGLFCVIFTSYSTAVVLNDVAAGLLPVDTVAKIVLIKLLIASEILLPVSLYFGVVVGLGRLHSNSEIIALSSCGIGEMRLVSIVLRLSLIIALVVACISLVARPWAYQQRYLLLAQAEAEFEIDDMEAKRFFVNPDSDYAIFADSVDHPTRTAGSVIVQIRRDETMQVIVAERLFQPQRDDTEPLVFTFEEGSVYHLDKAGGRDLIGRFNQLQLTLAAPEPRIVGYKSKTQTTLALHGSTRPKDLAEFQWRLSTPAVAVLLTLLAVPLSRTQPRHGRFARALAAILAYAVFYNLMAFAKNMVQEGLIGAIPGLWWPLVLLAVLLLVLLFRPWRYRPSRRLATHHPRSSSGGAKLTEESQTRPRAAQ